MRSFGGTDGDRLERGDKRGVESGSDDVAVSEDDWDDEVVGERNPRKEAKIPGLAGESLFVFGSVDEGVVGVRKSASAGDAGASRSFSLNNSNAIWLV